MAAKTPMEKTLKIYYIGWVGNQTTIRPVIASSPTEAKEIYAAWDGAPNPKLAAKRARQTRPPPGIIMGLPPINK
jgi:hypothetical protein